VRAAVAAEVHTASQHKNLYFNVEYTNNSNRNSTGFHNFNCVNSINIGNIFCVCVEKHIHKLCGKNTEFLNAKGDGTYRLILSLGNPNIPQ
jgi:hypothetical protein